MDNFFYNFDSDEDSEEELEEVDVDFEDNVLKRAIGTFILRLRASSNLRQPNIDQILLNLREVVSTYVRTTLHHVEEVLEQNGIELREFVNIQEELNLINCTQNLDTKHKQDKYFEHAFSMIKPQRYELGRRFIRHGTGTCGNDRPTKLHKDEMMIVPIADVLKQWIRHPEFRDVLQQHIPRDNLLSSDEDGLIFFQNAFFAQYRDAFRIILGFDEAQMCNPIGSKAGPKHNLGMIYWTLGNIHPMYRSNLKFMNLAGIVKSEDIQRYGMDAILAPIVENIQGLANGIEIENGDIIRANLFAICADNLGQHKISGFKEGFTAQHPCISCEANLHDVRTLTTENVNLIRTPESYLRQVYEIEHAVGAEKIRLSKLYGINRDTILNQIENFSPVVNIPPDVMHTILEGVFHRTIQLYLRKMCLIDQRITLDELNDKLQNFDYGYTELLCKPSVIKMQHLTNNFHQSASQTWLLAVILPLILRSIVDEDCEYTHNFSKLLEVSSIVMGHSINRGMIDYLAMCIAEYLTDFKRLYSDENMNVAENMENMNVAENMENEVMHIDGDIAIENIGNENDSGDENEPFQNEEGKKFTPKQHYMTHFPRDYVKFGSLVQFWCMKVEAKHALLKNKAKCVHNAKNLAFTLANWHQVNQTFQMTHTLLKEVVTGPRKVRLTETLPFQHLYPDNPTLTLVSWVRYNGTKYTARKCYIPVGYNDQNFLPLFAELFNIVIEDNLPVFICRFVETVEHNVRLMAYRVVTEENNYVKFTFRDLISPNVYHSS
ncbi:uncharacterized protein LOC127279936 [Leptopilina boulardi]|uniref:uncharacterized protein LOC127279936 n=1 Tax=Leptopilina boulardi TaxID=63433 RepID=UPI0021F5958C|nr:uncharacterized protein LOC127279936 [Leptopilina boulardi]